MTQTNADTLGPGQKRVYAALVAFHEEHHYMPSLRELCKLTGVHSTNGVASHLNTLHQKGYIQYTPKIARGVRILKGPMGYPTSIEEMSDEHLREELIRRDRLRRKGKCAYCTQTKGSEPACRMGAEHAAPFVDPERRARSEKLRLARDLVHSGLCHAHDVDPGSSASPLYWHIVNAAAAYWAEDPDDFSCDIREDDGSLYFGRHNQIRWTPEEGYQMNGNLCTQPFIERYLSIGPYPKGYV